MGIVWISYGGIALALLAGCAVAIMRLVSSLQSLVNKAATILSERDLQMREVLDNAASATAAVKQTTESVNKTVQTTLSIPNFLQNFAREIFVSIFKKEKR